jgi:hypothetical protein
MLAKISSKTETAPLALILSKRSAAFFAEFP